MLLPRKERLSQSVMLSFAERKREIYNINQHLHDNCFHVYSPLLEFFDSEINIFFYSFLYY